MTYYRVTLRGGNIAEQRRICAETAKPEKARTSPGFVTRGRFHSEREHLRWVGTRESDPDFCSCRTARARGPLIRRRSASTPAASSAPYFTRRSPAQRRTSWSAPIRAAPICGQVAGAFYGLAAIPPQWVEKLALGPLIDSSSRQLMTGGRDPGRGRDVLP